MFHKYSPPGGHETRTRAAGAGAAPEGEMAVRQPFAATGHADEQHLHSRPVNSRASGPGERLPGPAGEALWLTPGGAGMVYGVAGIK